MKGIVLELNLENIRVPNLLCIGVAKIRGQEIQEEPNGVTVAHNSKFRSIRVADNLGDCRDNSLLTLATGFTTIYDKIEVVP